MINCFIIDDERAAVNIIKNYVSRVDSLNLLGESIDPQEGLRLVNELKPDLLFLDIQMNSQQCMELYEQYSGVFFFNSDCLAN